MVIIDTSGLAPGLFIVVDSVKSFGKQQKYFKRISKDDDWFELTDKGNELKDSGIGYVKFEKRLNKSEWYNENWVGYLIAFIILVFTVFQYFQNDQLKDDIDVLKSQNNTLNIERDSLKSERDSLKSELDSLKHKYILHTKKFGE